VSGSGTGSRDQRARRGADDGVVESCSCEDDVRTLDGGFERGSVIDVAGDDLDVFCNQCLTRWLAGVTRCAADFPGGIFEEGGGDGTALVAAVSAYIILEGGEGNWFGCRLFQLWQLVWPF
jgi:hypothetical protein